MSLRQAEERLVSNKILMVILGVLASITGFGISTTPLAMGSILQVEPLKAFLIMLTGLVILIIGLILIIYGIKTPNDPECRPPPSTDSQQ